MCDYSLKSRERFETVPYIFCHMTNQEKRTTDDEIIYGLFQQDKAKEFEATCIRCGKCCGALDDPCRNLVMTGEDRYICRNYGKRFGPQLTMSGKQFNCVSIREHIAAGTLREGCGYRK